MAVSEAEKRGNGNKKSSTSPVFTLHFRALSSRWKKLRGKEGAEFNFKEKETWGRWKVPNWQYHYRENKKLKKGGSDRYRSVWRGKAT